MNTRPITVLLESRFQRDDADTWYTASSLEAGSGWAELVSVGPARLAARVSPGVAAGTRAVHGPTIALPNYTGVIGALRSLPALVRAIDRSVRGSSAVVVKLPGIIGLVAVGAARRARVPVIAQVVGDIEDVLHSGVAGRSGRLLAPVARAIVAAAVRRSRLVRYVTEHTLQQKYPPASDATAIAFSDVELLGAPAWQPSARDAAVRRVVAVGSQEQSYKGHDLLVHATAQLNARDLPYQVELILIGSGRTQSQLRELARALGQEGAVRFAGHISDPVKLRSLLLEADLFALPSRTEGMPRALIEAMGLGLPCIASRVGGVPELLPDEAIVAVGDVDGLREAIERVLSDEGLARRLSEAGALHAQRFAPEVREVRRARWLVEVARVARSGA
ncbi:glycosyltransferase [Agrococcus lahaulensis]|nr:glycosyltransferase [Agrococcus lahaulensis]